MQGTWAGLRPYREAVRLEIDRTSPGCKAKVSTEVGWTVTFCSSS